MQGWEKKEKSGDKDAETEIEGQRRRQRSTSDRAGAMQPEQGLSAGAVGTAEQEMKLQRGEARL